MLRTLSGDFLEIQATLNSLMGTSSAAWITTAIMKAERARSARADSTTATTRAAPEKLAAVVNTTVITKAERATSAQAANMNSYHESRTGQVACGNQFESYHKSRTGESCAGGKYDSYHESRTGKVACGGNTTATTRPGPGKSARAASMTVITKAELGRLLVAASTTAITGVEPVKSVSVDGIDRKAARWGLVVNNPIHEQRTGCSHGSPLKCDSGSASISLLCRRLKLPPGASLHTLRHTHATHMLVGGVPLQVVPERLGHSSVRTTAEVYAHSLRGQDDEAVRTLEEFVRTSRSAVPVVEKVQ
jgi:hypothetical protein